MDNAVENGAREIEAPSRIVLSNWIIVAIEDVSPDTIHNSWMKMDYEFFERSDTDVEEDNVQNEMTLPLFYNVESSQDFLFENLETDSDDEEEDEDNSLVYFTDKE